ncbi:MAG: UvrD-helicase domain-containing protein [Ilumatobacteraceae bacterium]
MSHPRLDLEGPLPSGRLVIEASAGTGKTYSLTALVVRHVAERGLSAADLLVVTFTRTAAAELRDRTRSAMVAALAALDSGTVPAEHQWIRPLLEASTDERAMYRERLSLAVSSFDDATITTIHSFCQLALRQLGLRSGAALGGDVGDSTSVLIAEVCRDIIVSTFVGQLGLLDSPTVAYSAQQAYDLLVTTVRARIGNPGSCAVPSLDDADDLGDRCGDPNLGRWVRHVEEAVRLVQQRRVDRAELGFEDLISGLRDAVVGDRGTEVVAALRSRFRLVLVDEFQDTDPVQWEIFETAFADRLITVGDPKQAIYRFRGADVAAYLAATEGRPTVQLDTNFRSDRDLVAATNHLLAGVTLGHPRIRVGEVESAATRPDRALGETPLTVRCLPDDQRLYKSRGFSDPLARGAIVSDLAGQVVSWLDHGEITTGAPGTGRRVVPGDIAVLVASRSQAHEVAVGLAAAGVPSVRTRTGSVLETDEADEWDLFLAALERPAHAPTVRAAGLGLFMRAPIELLDADSQVGIDHVASMQRAAARWAELLTRCPFLAWYDVVRAESGVLERLLSADDGERRLTDLDHLAELMAVDLGTAPLSAATARRALARLRAAKSDDNDLSPEMRRIDTDAAAVKILTLHSSKGLEFPIVLVPFAWQGKDDTGPWLFERDGVRHVDIAHARPWVADDGAGPDDRRRLAEQDAFGDRLRVLYVGLTRGMHRTVVWWAPSPSGATSALNTVLFGRDDDGVPHAPGDGAADGAPEVQPTAADAGARLAALAASSDGTVDVVQCDLDVAAPRWMPDMSGVALPTLSVADAAGRDVRHPAFRRWSFSSIHGTREHLWTPLHDVAVPGRGGADEPEPDPDREVPTGAASTVVPPHAGIAVPLADAPGGTAFGTLVHDVFERADVASADLETELARAVDGRLRPSLHGIGRAQLVAGLAAAARTPLGSILDDRRLVDITRADRLAEVSFDLPLRDTTSRLAVRTIGSVLLDTLAADDPQRGYAESLADGRFDLDIAGYLQGSIDAVLRVPAADGTWRHVVVDYKTNRLHAPGDVDPLAAYHPSLLPAEMAHADYVLQALLYSVATHRFLRWRMAGYDPDVHLGGIAYLFVRGMVGDGTPVAELADGTTCPYGVFAWRPPTSAVVALDELLAGRRAA